MESFRDFAAEKGHPLDIKIQPGLTYCGDEYAIRQLASILLDNAIKYALPDSPVTFSLEKGRKGIVIRTENACGEMDPKTLPKLFDRFYRPDQSRTSKTGGSALGFPLPGASPKGTKAPFGRSFWRKTASALRRS